MDGPWEGNHPGYGPHDAWWGFLHLLPLVLLLVLIGVVVWAVLRYSSRPVLATGTGAVGVPPRDAAVEELRIRYARGELGRDDFAQRMRDLGNPDIAPAQATEMPDDAPTSPEGDAPAGSG
jgi:putative membrane protein